MFMLLFLVLGVIFSSLFAKEEEPHIFEMVALPPSTQMTEEISLEPLLELTVDIEEPEPIELPEPPPPEPEPEPQPEPVQETPPPPQPVIQETPPPPVPVEKPEPKPEPKPKPKIISIDDFEREHGEIKEPPKQTIQPKPKPRPTIDTSEIEKRIRDAVGSVPELDVLTTTTTVDTDIMKAWRAMLAASLDKLWKQIDTKGLGGKEVTVSFFISAGGSISSVKVVRSSGLPRLDSLAVQTVQRLGSFQRPPSGKGEAVNVPFRID